MSGAIHILVIVQGFAPKLGAFSLFCTCNVLCELPVDMVFIKL